MATPVILQARRDGAAAKRFFKRLLRSHGSEPRKIVTDKLRSYPVAHRELTPGAIHVTAHAAVSNLFNLGRHRVRAQHYRDLRIGAFEQWSRAVA
jgi:putative transposase